MIAAHNRFLELAATSIDFELSRAEHHELESHVGSCASCRRDLMDLRTDAQRIRSLPMRAPAAARSSQITRPLLMRQRDGTSRRLVAIAALLALLLVGVAVAGSRLLLRTETPVLPAPSKSLPSGEPSPAVRPSRPDIASQLRVQRLDTGSLEGARLGAVAAAGAQIVAVGGTTCAVSSDGPSRCWARILTSRDGSSWTEVVASDATEVGDVTAPGHPSPGIFDVGGGAGGFVGVGYSASSDCTDALCPPVATIWTSPDGIDWSAWPGVLGETARPNAVAAYRSGWVVVGERFLPDGPRATVWTSDDGASWIAAADGPEFDIGGYLDTGDALQAGGIADVEARGGELAAAGKRCDSLGGACQVAIWASGDGRSWTLRESTQIGALRSVSAGPEGFVALGWLCEDASCLQDAVRAGGFRSADGETWDPVTIDVPYANLGIRGTAAGPAFVAIVETEAGTNVPLLASADGRSWTPLAGPLDIQGARAFGAAAATALADGSVLIVGWVETADASGSASFAYRIVDGT